MLKVNDKPLLEWWIKDVCDVGYKTYKGTYEYSKDDIAWAVICTLGAVAGTLFGLLLLLGLIIVTKGIALFVLLIAGAVVWGTWKGIEAVLNGGEDS
jgi:hypothetical protein